MSCDYCVQCDQTKKKNKKKNKTKKDVFKEKCSLGEIYNGGNGVGFNFAQGILATSVGKESVDSRWCAYAFEGLDDKNENKLCSVYAFKMLEFECYRVEITQTIFEINNV